MDPYTVYAAVEVEPLLYTVYAVSAWPLVLFSIAISAAVLVNMPAARS